MSTINDIETTTSSKDPASLDQALRASEARFRNIIEKSLDGVVVVCEDGTICYANPAATAFFGRGPDELLGQVFGRPVIPGETTEIDIPRGDGAVRVAELRAVETEWEGMPAVLATLRDVTERKQVAEAQRFLAEAGRILADSLDLPTTLARASKIAVTHLADGCLIDLLDRDRTLQRSVVAHRDPKIESQAHELKGCYTIDLTAPNGLPRVLRTGRSQVFPELPDAVLGTLVCDLQQLLAIRKLHVRSLMMIPLLARGRTLGAITLFSTCPSRRLGPADLPLAEELARRAALAIDNALLYDESQEAIRRRDQFLAMLAHELRNPLAPILNAASILRHQKPDDPASRRATEVIERQGRQMARLLDDLLDISRVTRGTIQLLKQSIDFCEIVREAAQACAPYLEVRKQELSTSLPPYHLWLEADPTRIEQVVVNLLNNAAKFSKPGGLIRLSVFADGSQVVLRVRDTGRGMSPDMLSRVFDLFVQGDASLDRSQSGLGIGLTLVKNLVEMHGGTVTASSAGLDQGSEFVVRLPLAVLLEAQPVPEIEDGSPAGEGLRVLIVEDIKDNREMLRDLLRLWGHQVEVAEDGNEGLESIRRLRPDIALVDIGLPGLDGFQVAQEVRTDPELGQTMLVALTGYAQPEDRRRAQAAGFDAHLVKPVNLDELGRILSREG